MNFTLVLTIQYWVLIPTSVGRLMNVDSLRPTYIVNLAEAENPQSLHWSEVRAQNAFANALNNETNIVQSNFQVETTMGKLGLNPDEAPVVLLGSVFDANSLGKSIHDWTVFHHGPGTPMSEVAGDLWLLLIKVAHKIKRPEDVTNEQS